MNTQNESVGDLTMTPELRCFTFTLFQLSTMQQAIQASHATIELLNSQYHNPLVREWADEYKTVVWLNGGNLKELRNLIDFFTTIANPFPWEVFHESGEALDGIETSVAIILPERIFETANSLRKNKGVRENLYALFTDWEWNLIERLAAASMAR